MIVPPTPDARYWGYITFWLLFVLLPFSNNDPFTGTKNDTNLTDYVGRSGSASLSGGKCYHVIIGILEQYLDG